MTNGIDTLPPWANPQHHVSKRQAQTIKALRARLSLALDYVRMNQGGWCRNGITAPEILDACEEQKP